MKSLLFILLMALSPVAFSQTYPIQNSYAPTYEDVVIINDHIDDGYLPQFYHASMDVLLEMPMHDSCLKVEVKKIENRMAVICHSKANQQTEIGTLSSTAKRVDEHAAFQINWGSNVELKQFQNPRTKALSYAVVVK